MLVVVHTLGSSKGAGSLARCDSTAALAKALQRCWRQVSITVNIVSTKRLPAALCVQNDSFRQITALRNDPWPLPRRSSTGRYKGRSPRQPRGYLGQTLVLVHPPLPQRVAVADRDRAVG